VNVCVDCTEFEGESTIDVEPFVLESSLVLLRMTAASQEVD
jgi:hypothetical protein